jgi:PA14 domain
MRFVIAMGWMLAAGALVRVAWQRHGDEPHRASLIAGSAVQMELCSARSAVGVGLLGEYFANAQLQGKPAKARLDPVIDFGSSDWELSSDLADMRIGSVRWSGWVKAPLSGTYRFHVDALGSRVLLSQREITPDQPFEMVAGRFYPVHIEWRTLDADRDARRIRFEWTAPHGARYLVPRALLFQPSETAVR